MNYKKLVLGIIIIALAVWVLLGLFRFGSIIAFLWIFEIIVNELTLAAGLNKYLAMIIAFVPALALLWSVPLMFSLNKRKRNLGMIMGGACYLLYSILMFSLESNHYFDPATGALSTLVDKTAKRALCALQTNPIGLFRYESFSQDDYDRFLAAYIVDIKRHGFWAIPDFSKPGMAHAVPRPCHCMYGPRLLSAYIKPARDATFVILELTMPEFAIKELGAPGQLFIEYAFRKKNIDITLQWFKKNACRLPEAAWFSFVPKVAQPGQWLLDKLGHPVSPLDVVDKGNRNLHAINTGVSYKGPDGVLAIASPDAPLVAPGEPRLLQFDNTQPPLEQGMHFNLVNNLWGTNFVMWYEDDARFRFSLTVSVENTTAK